MLLGYMRRKDQSEVAQVRRVMSNSAAVALCFDITAFAEVDYRPLNGMRARTIKFSQIDERRNLVARNKLAGMYAFEQIAYDIRLPW